MKNEFPSYSIDSRTLKPSDIYIPLKGNNFDGRDFLMLLRMVRVRF